MTEKLKILSGVFLVKPKILLTLNAGGMIRLTPKKTYLAFRTNYEIKNQPGKETIMIVKDEYRYFPVTVSYAKNNFNYIDDVLVSNLKNWITHFNKINEHIRKDSEKIELTIE